jgi:perosamine synthetase
MMFDDVIKFIRELYEKPEGIIPLHEPVFWGHEKAYVADAIDSTFVSSVGRYVDRFEKLLVETTKVKYAVATVNGTAALHVSLLLADVKPGDEVITQPLTFVATCNAIHYCGAIPHFIDVDRNTMSLCPIRLQEQLESIAEKRGGFCYNKNTHRRITACVPMHTFGHPAKLDELVLICKEWGIAMVEDAAESLGSLYKGRHTGSYGLLSSLSFNGNKIITTGGGGAILTNDENLAKKAKHLTTTAKVTHDYQYVHDQIGYNYRMPNLNAALGCGQLEQLESLVESKRNLAKKYRHFFAASPFEHIEEPLATRSNYWLNAVILKNHEQQRHFLETTNADGILTRPIWKLMHRLEMFKNAPRGNLDQAIWLEERVVNLPSTPLLSHA